MPDPFDDLRRYAADLRAEVSPGVAEARINQILAAPSPRSGLRRAVVAVTTVGLLGVSNVAVAAVANPAVPGDALYGVDRTYERVERLIGVGGVHAQERLDEAAVLVEQGRAIEALELVNEAITNILEADDPAAEAAAVAGPGNELFADTLDRLRAVAKDVDSTGADVAEIARSIVDTVDLPDQARGNPGGPNRGDGDPPGNSGGNNSGGNNSGGNRNNSNSGGNSGS